MLHDNNLIEMSYDSIDQSHYSEQDENYHPVLEKDLGQEKI